MEGPVVPQEMDSANTNEVNTSSEKIFFGFISLKLPFQINVGI
jgi:hypothetical protein